ncbi:FAD-dependent pyridine nucleotide-disulphide oxidoreductase [Methylocella silvestris BL2]|uniref:FAD-dependent pyridine nucleotide-disulphide oxidoreductase n=1 Tax=Methylocella silvestris (strain DSM 15510 / CIP 108128 / LMG 27833 / NCIMB 13906 / BL2) TaxID=395965 RepID=B8ESU4_METSB|nr:FAD-dependent oxidoreductase [Methylocella silvestris]ACK50429.1 FAD-dependent pyridine nucleotide-disulphide oxidoreductase [Methylocella silvestris BL2]
MSGGVVIVGAGQAGARTALELRALGYEGRITLIGDEPYPPYERPNLSKEMISDVQTKVSWVSGEKDYADAEINIFLATRVERIDRAKQSIFLNDGTTCDYEYLVLATGGRPRQLPFVSSRICTLRTVDDALRIRDLAAKARKVIVVGAGVIGLEVASTLCAMGIETTVVEQGPGILGRGFPSNLAAYLADLHQVAGIRILTSVGIGAVRDADAELSVELGTGETLTCDFAVVGIGITPNVSLAEKAGLSIDNGIIVDSQLRTSDIKIYAVGDNAIKRDENGRLCRVETWQNANLTATAAAASITGRPRRVPDVPWFWTDQLGHNIQLAGKFDEFTTSYERYGVNEGSKVFLYLKRDILVGAATVDAGREMSLCRRLIQACKRIEPELLEPARLDMAALQAALKVSLV